MDALIENEVSSMFCVLPHRSTAKDSYGYQIRSKDVPSEFAFGPTRTLYPLLNAWYRRGAARRFTPSSHNGRLRKYYRITPARVTLPRRVS